MNEVGVVAIGRNEGERLRRCLASAVGRAAHVVYVDSGSSDGSAEVAREMGASVVELDMSKPFTAARARNEGFDELIRCAPQIQFVQFVDGDCEIVEGWLERAASELERDEKLAVVCGRRRERFPESSVYNQLIDLEWDTPIGEAKSCGGDAMIRVIAFQQVGGYNPTVIAGEEPEMCVRLRQTGWKILRVDAEMTRHDAAMTRLGQWWTRNVRAGHARAEGRALHGGKPERFNVKQSNSNWLWGWILPVLVIVLAWLTRGLSLLLLAAYPVLWYRTYRARRARGTPKHLARLYAFYVVLGKVPQALGQMKYHIGRLTGRRSAVIEYKGPAPQSHHHEPGAPLLVGKGNGSC